MNDRLQDLLDALRTEGVPSEITDAFERPSGDTDNALPGCDFSRSTSRPAAKSQARIVLSSAIEIRLRPPGRNATERTSFRCPKSIFSGRPVRASSRRISPPKQPTASVLLSGEKATAWAPWAIRYLLLPYTCWGMRPTIGPGGARSRPASDASRDSRRRPDHDRPTPSHLDGSSFRPGSSAAGMSA